MILKIYSKQFQQQFLINRTPNMILKQGINQIKQHFGCNNATLITAQNNGKILDLEMTLEELKIGLNQQITLFLSYFQHIKFQLNDNIKQVKTLQINIYMSILEVEKQLIQHFRIDYDVQIILKDQNISKEQPFSKLDINKVHIYQIYVKLVIEIENKQQLLCCSVFERISNIKQIIRKQMQIKGRFQILYNDGIQLDIIKNMEETIYSLQIPNYQILKIHRLQYITLNYKFNNCSEYYKVQLNQNLEYIINQFKDKHKDCNNSINQIKCNGYLQSINAQQLEKIKEYIMEDVIELEQNKDESIIITMINYFELANRQTKIFHIKQNFGELKNVIKQNNCNSVELFYNDNMYIDIDIDSKTFQQHGFVANQHYLIFYKFIQDYNQNQQLSLLQNSQYFNKQYVIGNDKQNRDIKIQQDINHPETLLLNYNSQIINRFNSSVHFTERSLINDQQHYQEELQTDNQNSIVFTIISKQFSQVYEFPQIVQENQNNIISQTEIYKNLLTKLKSNIKLKYQDQIIDINKSFKDLGISHNSKIEVIHQSDDQQDIISQINQQNQNIQEEISQNNAKINIQFQFQKDGILRKEYKIYNKETIKFSLIKKALLNEYQLSNNFEIMYNDKKVDLNSNISGIIQENQCLFILKEQENLIVNLRLSILDNGSEEIQYIQVHQDLEISNIFYLIEQELKQKQFNLFYDGYEISNQKDTFIQLNKDAEKEVEVVL